MKKVILLYVCSNLNKMKILLYITIVAIFTSCTNKVITKKIKGEILFSKNGNSYFYDLKIDKSHYIFLDDKSDTLMYVYNKNNTSTPVLYVLRRSEKTNLINPFFTKDVLSSKYNDTITVIDNHTYIKKIYLMDNKLEICSSLFIRDLTRSFDYNITSKELYASPFFREKCYSFYYYNPKEKYYWVDPSEQAKKVLSYNPIAYTSNICVNEEYNTIVTSYRFSNLVSFYDLKGKIKNTVQVGENIVIPYIENDRIDMQKSIKCFISIAGTKKYAYCLYNGRSDFSNNSTIYVFTWEGKLIATWELDRNLRALATSENDDIILGISSNSEDGQDIISYSIKNKS